MDYARCLQTSISLRRIGTLSATFLLGSIALQAQTLVVLPFANRTSAKTTQGNMDWIGESIA